LTPPELLGIHDWREEHDGGAAFAEEFTEQLRIHGCVNHHFINFMMMKAIMKVFDDLRRVAGRATTQT
jgi:hypothetical protein